MISFRGDSQENEEKRQLLAGLQSTLGTTSQQLAERITSVSDSVGSLEHAHAALAEDVKGVSRQVSGLDNHFNEIAKFLEESFNALHERSKKLEASGALRFDALDVALQTQKSAADSQTNVLQGQLIEQARRLDALESSLTARLAHLDDWKRTLPPDEQDDEAMWLDGINTDLLRLAQSEELRGNARLFVNQLSCNLRELRQISGDIQSRERAHFAADETVQHLDATLFRPHFGVEWIDIAEGEYGRAGLKSRARAELRALETAVLNYRRRLQERLIERHQFKPIYIVPRQTSFDPALHETTDMYSLPTSERAQDNRILSVEKNGYQLAGEVLLRAFVRRLVWSENTSPAPAEERKRQFAEVRDKQNRDGLAGV